MLVLLSNSLLLKEEIVQRSVFTRWSPIVAAATFFPNFKILDPPFFDFILPGIVWFPKICHSSAINFDFLNTVEFVYFQSLTFALPMILFYHYRKFIED